MQLNVKRIIKDPKPEVVNHIKRSNDYHHNNNIRLFVEKDNPKFITYSEIFLSKLNKAQTSADINNVVKTIVNKISTDAELSTEEKDKLLKTIMVQRIYPLKNILFPEGFPHITSQVKIEVAIVESLKKITKLRPKDVLVCYPIDKRANMLAAGDNIVPFHYLGIRSIHNDKDVDDVYNVWQHILTRLSHERFANLSLVIDKAISLITI